MANLSKHPSLKPLIVIVLTNLLTFYYCLRLDNEPQKTGKNLPTKGHVRIYLPIQNYLAYSKKDSPFKISLLHPRQKIFIEKAFLINGIMNDNNTLSFSMEDTENKYFEIEMPEKSAYEIIQITDKTPWTIIPYNQQLISNLKKHSKSYEISI